MSHSDDPTSISSTTYTVQLVEEPISPFSAALKQSQYDHLKELTDSTLSKRERRCKHLSCSSVMEFSELLKSAGVGFETLQSLDESESTYDSEPESDQSTPSLTIENRQATSVDPIFQLSTPLGASAFMEQVSEDGLNNDQSSPWFQILRTFPQSPNSPHYSQEDSPEVSSPSSPKFSYSSMRRKKTLRKQDVFMRGGRYGTNSKDLFSTLFKRGEKKEFGVDLLQVMSRKSEKGHEVPALIEEMMVIVSENSSVEGLFRVGGSVKEMDALVKKIDSGKVIELRTLNIHVITGLTKKYIRMAKLIPVSSYPIFTSIAQKQDENEIEKELTNVFKDVSVIPYYNCLLLNRLLHLLYNIQLKKSENQMTSSNLAIIFAPNLFQQDDSGTVTTLAASLKLNSYLVLQTKGTKLISVLIDKYEEVFKPIFETIRKTKRFKPKRHAVIFSDEEVVKKGIIGKRNKVKQWKKRCMVLTRNHLFLFENEEELFTAKILSEVALVDIVKLSAHEKKEFCFVLTFKITENEEEVESWTFKCENEEEKDQWLSFIQQAMKDQVNNNENK